MSTDSEGLNNSTSPLHQPQPNNVIYSNTSAAAAALVAVLSDEPGPPIQSPPSPIEVIETPEIVQKSKKQKSKSIKLKIKTSIDEVIATKTTRSTRRKKETPSNNYQEVPVASVEPLVSVVNEFPVNNFAESQVTATDVHLEVPKQIAETPISPERNRRRTAAAKKQYKTDHSELKSANVVPPVEPEPVPSVIIEKNENPVNTKRRKGKKTVETSASEPIIEPAPIAPEPVRSSGRVTRNKVASNMMQVSIR